MAADINAPSSSRRLLALQRRQEATRLRMAGLSFREIAQRVGVTPRRAWVMVQESLSEMRRDIEGNVAELRAMELARLDVAQAALWKRVLAGEDGAVSSLIRIMDRRAKLLGLDAPQQVAQTLSIEYDSGKRVESAFALLGVRAADDGEGN